jgi:predicted DNA-binding protein YlxM (UPF0122 family)
MEERVQLSILLDIYGELLTEKQKDIMDLYYNDDLSLGEICEFTNTSRQAVHDIIKRCHKLLLQYEVKLGFMKHKSEMNELKLSLLKLIDLLNISDSNDLRILQKLKEYISENI